MSKHTITAEIEVSFHLLGAPDDERESAWPKIEITYTFSPGTPECRYQRNGDRMSHQIIARALPNPARIR